MTPESFLPALVRWESRVKYMYLDSASKDGKPAPNVTIGIGCLLPNLVAAQALPFWYSDIGGDPPRKAVPKEIEWDWRRVSALAPGNRAGFYLAQGTQIFLDDAGIDGLALGRLTTDRLPACRRLFHGFDMLPRPVQIAIVDMCWNMGAGMLATFHKFIAAIQAGDFKTAAKECHRSSCRDERNAWCADQFALTATPDV